MAENHPNMHSLSKLSCQLAHRPLLAITLSFCAGIILARLLHIQDILHLAMSLLLLLLGFLFLRLSADFPYTIIMVLMLICGFAGYLIAANSSDQHFADYYGQYITATGIVSEEPVNFEQYTLYQLKVEKLTIDGQVKYASGKVMVSLYGPDNEQFSFGERLVVSGTLTKPKGIRNPGGFDHRFYLQSQGVGAVIYTHSSQVYGGDNDGRYPLKRTAHKIRGKLEQFIVEHLPAPPSQLMNALLFGQRQQLPEQISQSFQRAGVGHLMAVSGLHVGLIAAMLLALWSKLGLRGRLPVALAIVLIFIYAWLTGMRPSTLRAALMVSAALGAVLLDRERDIATAIAFAALVTLIVNPLLLFNVGFQLSYTATLTLVYLYRPLAAVLKKIWIPLSLRPYLAVTLAAQIGVLPLCLFHFQHLPTGAIIFNILLLPLIPLVIGLGLAGSLVGLISSSMGSLLLWAARPILELMMAITSLSHKPFFYLPTRPPALTFVASYYLFIVLFAVLYYMWLLLLKKMPQITVSHYLQTVYAQFIASRKKIVKVSIALLLVMALLFVWSSIIFPGKEVLTVTFIDVGQGSAALVETPCGLTIMIDAGGNPAFKGDVGAVGEKIILPFLRYKGIKKINLAIITHPHEDHYGGFLPLVSNIEIDQILIPPVSANAETYNILLDRLAEKGTASQKAYAGQYWSCGESVMIEIIHPPEESLKGTGSDLNNNSITFILYYGHTSILFTGDIEDSAVESLLSGKANLTASVLQIPHHGGYLAAIERFLEAVMPEIAVIQVGHNSFGHPHPYVIEALANYGVVTYRNDHHGAIIIESDGKSIGVITMDNKLKKAQ